MKKIKVLTLVAMVFCVNVQTGAQSELIKYGDFNQWIVRNIKESKIIGGATKQLYEVGPDAIWNNNDEYTNQGGSPWATSNVMARVCGITKTNTSVYREKRGDGYCARLETHEEKVKVLGIVNIEVLAAGSLFLGHVPEPITSTSNPMNKLSLGIPFTKRPKALRFDYKVKMTGEPNRIRQTGFSRISKVEGPDMADALVILQKRWEDENGKIHAKRVGTMVYHFSKSTNDWVNGAEFPILYGDISNTPGYQEEYMGMMIGDRTFNAENSRGKVVPIKEEGWADANETPTHVVVKFDSSCGGAYIGSIGSTLWVDNVEFVY